MLESASTFPANPKPMPRTIPEAVRELCLSLPDTEEVSRHGAPNFKVRGKTFAMYVVNHHGDGRVALWLCAPPGAQELYTGLDPESYFVPPYVGVKGWLGMELNRNLGWKEIQARVRECYEHVSPLANPVIPDQLPVVEPPDTGMRPEDINPWLGPTGQAILAQFESTCRSFPETVREEGAGHPVWKAGRKPYARATHHEGRLKLQFRVGVEQQAFLGEDPRYSIPLYYGPNGWIDLDVHDAVNWDEVKSLLDCSYRQVALKRMLKALD